MQDHIHPAKRDDRRISRRYHLIVRALRLLFRRVEWLVGGDFENGGYRVLLIFLSPLARLPVVKIARLGLYFSICSD